MHSATSTRAIRELGTDDQHAGDQRADHQSGVPTVALPEPRALRARGPGCGEGTVTRPCSADAFHQKCRLHTSTSTIRKRFSHLWCEMTKKQTIRNAFLNCTLVCPPIRSHHHKFLARRPFWAGASPLPGARHGGAPLAESTLLQEAYLNLRLSENG